jgi:electron transport complex protein RnfD
MTTPISGPHYHGRRSVGGIMAQVMLALVPATAFALWQFGWPAVFLFLLTLGSAVFTEALSLRLAGKPLRPFLLDGSGLLTAWLLALSLPPWAPWWIGVVGGAFAIVLGKQVFGGIGQNLFNPAMLARVALLISFPVQMTRWTVPQPLFGAGAPGFVDGLKITFLGGADIDTLSGATVLGHSKTELTRGVGLDVSLSDVYAPLDHLLGLSAGSLGETSALLLLLGGLFLLARRIITWQIPAAMLGTVALLAGVMHLIDPLRYADPLLHVLAGGLMLGAFFIATDPVTSPSSGLGQLVFGAGCGALIYVIRTWGGFPEGLAFAVLIMNAATPLIDHYLRPRVYGRNRRGAPLTYAPEQLGREKE